jgi:hypothetical protein
VCDLSQVTLSVASLCFKCFRCFIGMLQLFCMDVAKVDRDVAYVAIVVHVCCKFMFPTMFYLFFQTYVTSVFIWMFRACVSYMCCNCFI